MIAPSALNARAARFALSLVLRTSGGSQAVQPGSAAKSAVWFSKHDAVLLTPVLPVLQRTPVFTRSAKGLHAPHLNSLMPIEADYDDLARLCVCADVDRRNVRFCRLYTIHNKPPWRYRRVAA